jgi:hypothetical protein
MCWAVTEKLNTILCCLLKAPIKQCGYGSLFIFWTWNTINGIKGNEEKNSTYGKREDKHKYERKSLFCEKMKGKSAKGTHYHGGKPRFYKPLNPSYVEKKVPREWINKEGNGVTGDFIKYALPLIQGESTPPFENGLPRFAKLKKILATK